LGKVVLQILYYITFGDLGIWTLIRLFTLNGAIKAYNKELAIKQGLSADEMMQLGVI
jgi:hypothetical protein